MLVRTTLLLTLVSLRCAAQDSLGAEPGRLVTVPALTPVLVRLGEEISSNKNKPGDRFRIFIAEDVLVEEVLVIPAGSEGEGEVVHAAKAGAGGKAGELILAARFVRVGAQEVRLRSFGLAGAGADHTKDALGVSVLVGPVAFLIRGGARIFPRDGVAGAKTAEKIQLPAREAPSLPVEAAPVDKTTEGSDDETKTS